MQSEIASTDLLASSRGPGIRRSMASRRNGVRTGVGHSDRACWSGAAEMSG
jgi:hypothetical protein